MNMEYWIGVVQVVNGVSFFGMLFSYAAAAILMFTGIDSASENKNPAKMYKSAIVVAALGVVFTLLLIFVPSAAAVKAMYT